MKKSKKKSKKINILLIITLISMYIVIPNLLISIQRNIEIPIDERNPNEIINTRPPQESSVYYEATTGLAYGVYVSGDYAYVADYDSGLAVIDISDPTNPGTPVYEDTTGWAYGVYVSGDYAYMADYDSGLAIINISDPTNPGTPIYADTTGDAYDVYVSGDYAYVADYDSGLAVIQVRKRVDREDPIISNAPSDLTVEAGYTGQIVSWTAIDANPDTYTIELQGTGIVAGPTAWTSGNAINYDIPDGFSVGSYIYTINFTDNYDHFITDSVNFTVEEDTTKPKLVANASDLVLNEGYTGQSISWTATDANPDNYTIELQGAGLIAGPTAWTSNVAITYNIPDGFTPGIYTYNITFTDESGYSISDTVTVTINSIGEPPGGAIPFELIIIASVIGGGAVIGVAVVIVILLRRKRK
ncbi:hypothetical protein ES705_04304 [subsurface metagenome]